MKLRYIPLTLLFLCCPAVSLLAAPTTSSPPKVSRAQAEFFEKRIRPLLSDNCFSCHGPRRQRGDLRLDSRASLMKGAGGKAVVIPGKAEKSRLIAVIRYKGEIKMPPKQKLPDAAIADLTAWVNMGAPWPGAEKTVVAKDKSTKSAKDHWAFQSVQKPPLPMVKGNGWVKSPVDAFVLAKLEAKGLTPAAPADRRALLRRAYFDLIGLPPTAEETEAFVKESRTDPQAAFAKVVDRLLNSPHYGERWGRHWLDIARYADTKGYVFQEERRFPFSYTYRDYVIRAFNEDKPYNHFILEQLAADQLAAENRRFDKKNLAAMGFLTLGRRFLNNQHDIIDDRIDVVSRGLLGLTVGCARCHDHKYDPIPQKDYYSLYGVFASSLEPKELPQIGEPAPTPAYIAYKKKETALKAAVEKYKRDHERELAKRNRKFRNELRALEKKVARLQATSRFAPPRAMVLVDRPNPIQPHVFRRGKPNNPGPAVPRQFLEVLSGPQRKPFAKGSGRLELARAIASKNNPLTARVMVNRIWLHHFGKGLVDTPSDFGTRSGPPSHPKLLDYLAWYFMENGWSIKKMHRLIMLSSVYQQASVHPCETKQTSESKNPKLIDPENRLLWKMNRRRLDFEAMRDALLFVSGNLDNKMGGRSVDITKLPFTGRRTVYAFIERQNLPGLFRTFDFASPDATTPQRYQTTVPQQALFMMNSSFLHQQARGILKRKELSGDMTARDRIQRIYRIIFGRNPDAEEMKLGLAFVSRRGSGKDERPLHLDAWERYAQVLLMSNEFCFVD